MTTLPHIFQYDGDGIMRSLRPKRADTEFVIGQRYTLAEQMSRSEATHNHQFAFIAEAWAQLPERMADDFATPLHLRKACLIDVGFFNEVRLDVGSTAAALRVAAQMKADDEFARVVVRGPIVVRRTAKSQKRSEMTAKDFQDAKTKIIDLLSAMIGVTPETLERESGKAA